jgi:uroporphyrin-III C-methyltransferase
VAENLVSSKLTLVGAGPGDPDLITVKGIKALAEADVVLYDALANMELLHYAPSRSKKIYVGKRSGRHYLQQHMINRMIVKYAHSHRHIVRLKGGDPFIFGRGLEEIEFAQKHRIQTEIIPGISSALAVPALQHIPLTHRGISDCFWVITGTTRSGEFSRDLICAAKSNATIVVLMGMKKLDEILTVFKTYDKHDTPVAIVQNGSLPNEKLGLGTVATISKEVENKGLTSPAIIVIGEIVRYTKKEEFANFESLAEKY